MEDYKLKYLKYKKKYLNLKLKVGGADLTYDEQLKLALALSNAGDEVVPQGEAKKSLAERQDESRARAEKAANDELQRVLRESAAEAERQMRASVPVAAAAPAVPQGEAKKSLAEKQAESRARAEKAANDGLQKALRDSAHAARRQRRAAAAAPAIRRQRRDKGGVIKEMIKNREPLQKILDMMENNFNITDPIIMYSELLQEIEDEQLKAGLEMSKPTKIYDRGAAAPNAHDLHLEPYNPNAVTLARVNQYSTEGSKSACTVICTEFATWVLEYMRVPNVDEISEIINRGIKIYRAQFTGHTSFPEASGAYRGRFTFQHLQKGSKSDLIDIITKTSKKAIELRNFICIGITKGGESIMICCAPDGKIMLFDSHPKPDLGLTSAYMIEFNNIIDALKYLTEHKIFFIEDLGIQYNTFDAYIIEKR